MSEFDVRAREWDKDKMHTERSVAIAGELEKMIPLNHSMRALLNLPARIKPLRFLENFSI